MAYADESVENAQKKSLKECLKTIKKLPDGWYEKFACFYHRYEYNDFYYPDIHPYMAHNKASRAGFMNTIKFYGMCFEINFVEPLVCTSCTADDYPCDGWIDYRHFCH
jgi:hypothetical protein